MVGMGDWTILISEKFESLDFDFIFILYKMTDLYIEEHEEQTTQTKTHSLDTAKHIIEILENAFDNNTLKFKSDAEISVELNNISNLQIDINDKLKAINAAKQKYNIKDIKKYLKDNNIEYTKEEFEHVKVYLKYRV